MTGIISRTIVRCLIHAHYFQGTCMWLTLEFMKIFGCREYHCLLDIFLKLKLTSIFRLVKMKAACSFKILITPTRQQSYNVVLLVLRRGGGVRSHIAEVLCVKAHSHDKASTCLANCSVFFIECTTINIDWLLKKDVHSG